MCENLIQVIFLVYLKTYPSKFPMPCKTTEVKNLFMPPAFVPGAKLGGDVTRDHFRDMETQVAQKWLK